MMFKLLCSLPFIFKKRKSRIPYCRGTEPGCRYNDLAIKLRCAD